MTLALHHPFIFITRCSVHRRSPAKQKKPTKLKCEREQIKQNETAQNIRSILVGGCWLHRTWWICSLIKMFQCAARSSAFFCFVFNWNVNGYARYSVEIASWWVGCVSARVAHLQWQFSATRIQSAIVKKGKLMRIIITLRESNHHRTSWRREMCASPTRLHKYQPSELSLSLSPCLPFARRINTVNSRYRNMSSFFVPFLLSNIHSSA